MARIFISIIVLVSFYNGTAQNPSYRWSPIYFENNSSQLTSESLQEIEGIIRTIKKIHSEKPDLKIGINGHADKSESPPKKLSKSRAQAVKNKIIEMGFTEISLEIEFWGASMPRAKPDTDRGRKMNQRVELKINAL